MNSYPIVGKYRVMEELGKGAFATVYRAQHIETKKIVALKKWTDSTKMYECTYLGYLNG